MTLVESFELTPDFKFKASSQIRDDGGVPILVVNSESETMMVSMVRQPDSDTFRFWEMAGTAHGGGESAEAMTAVLVRDGISEGLPVVEGRNTIAWDYIARPRSNAWSSGSTRSPLRCRYLPSPSMRRHRP